MPKENPGPDRIWIERWKYDQLAGYVHQCMEGDTHHIEEMYALLRSTGNADEEGFPIYPEDEE